MGKEAQYSSQTESTPFKRKYAPHTAIQTKRTKPEYGAPSISFDSIDVKPQCLSAAKNLLKKKSSLEDDHDEEKTALCSPFVCGICFDYKPVSDMLHGKCNHPFCTLCISKHVATQIHQNILKVNCPYPNCHVELEPQFFHAILPAEVVVRWETARCESLLVGLEKTYCPYKDCSVLLVNDGGEVVTSAECPSCHRLFCAQCKVPWHGSMSCQDFQMKTNMDEKELDNKFSSWQKGKIGRNVLSAICLCRDVKDVNILLAGVDATSATVVGRIGGLDIYARSN